MFRRLYDKIMALAQHRHAAGWLALVSFVESSFFPIPPDVMLIPMVMADRKKAWFYAGLCTLASVIGGCFGYAIGYFLYETVGVWIVSLYHLEHEFDVARQAFIDNAIQIMVIKGLIPIIPYKLITITAGVAKMDILLFTVTSIIVRAMRFYLVAALLWKFGAPVRDFIEKRLGLVTTLFAVGLVGGFILVKVLLSNG
ncbi:MAG: DedA family protein [Alphaproteobacteria bacterium]|jgi:membrane protein YqaA with SNARE-associated domain|nr:DedA family protein [Alphaproteobacteria bacterium]